MERKRMKKVRALVFSIAVVSAVAAATGIFSGGRPGPYEYESIRGRTVTIHGRGLYRHMSSDVAIQGIAQDYVTLFIGVPLLLFALFLARKGSLRGHFLLAGALAYFLVTYLFYLVMGMYNHLFLAYAFIMGASFFAFSMVILSFEPGALAGAFSEKAPVKFAGGFLVFNAFAVALMWLSLVVPPLLDGSLYPKELAHYTTLIVQGLDLRLFLPLAVVSGLLLRRKRPSGYLLGPVYFVFLSILMTALTAKIVAMGLAGFSIIPAVIIIPAINIISIIFSLILLRNIRPAGAGSI